MKNKNNLKVPPQSLMFEGESNKISYIKIFQKKYSTIHKIIYGCNALWTRIFFFFNAGRGQLGITYKMVIIGRIELWNL